MIWVTFSNGFSNHTEKLHQEDVVRYIAECHRQGIHVMAYESIANMFWQDMYKNVPESRAWPSIGKNGKPVPYGSADYEKVGYISRFMADLGNPEWLVYLRKRLDIALDAGADGIIYDNNSTSGLGQLLNVYRMIYQYGSSRQKDFLLMGNFHLGTYVFNRVTNCMTTEDGLEPGIYDEAHAHLLRESQYAIPIGQGFLVDNVGLFRLLDSLSQGWKPNLVEDGRREYAERLSTPMSPTRQELALAEAMSFGVAEELYVEDALATGLWKADPEAIAEWNAISKYNHFFDNHEEYFVGTKPVAPIAVVLDDTSSGVGVLNGLGARNVLFDVLYERDLTNDKLARYSAVALLTAKTVKENSLAELERYVRNGGKLLVAGDATTLDETGHARVRPSWFGQNRGKGECTYFDQMPSLDKLAEILKSDQGTKIPTLSAPPGIVYNVVERPGKGQLIVHLLNYGPIAEENFKLALNKKYSSATLLSPDVPGARQLSLHRSGEGYELVLPKLAIYSMLVLTQ